jgi:PST family polysaccharide transporter
MGWLMISQGRSKDVLRWGIINGSITFASFLVGLPWGAFGVAVSFSVTGALIRMPLLFWFATRVGPIRAADIYGSIAIPLLAACSLVGTIYAFRRLVDLSPLAGVSSSAAIALVVTAIVFLVTPKGRTGIMDLKAIIEEIMGRGAQNQVV